MKEVKEILVAECGSSVKTVKIVTSNGDGGWCFGEPREAPPYAAQVPVIGESLLKELGARYWTWKNLSELRATTFPPTIFETQAQWGCAGGQYVLLSGDGEKVYLHGALWGRNDSNPINPRIEGGSLVADTSSGNGFLNSPRN